MVKQTEYEVAGRKLIIHMVGDLDHHVAEQIRKQADKLIEQENINHVVFDFTRSDFMDSSGIGVMMGRYQKLHYKGGKVSAMGLNGRVEKIFLMSGLDRIIKRLGTERR